MAIGPVEANPDLTARCIAMLAPHRDEREMPARHGRWTVCQLPAGEARAALTLMPIKRLSLFKRILAAVLPCCFRRFRIECGMNDFNQHLANTFRLLRGMAQDLAVQVRKFDADVALDDLIAQCRQMRAGAMWATRDDETYRAVVLEGFHRYLSSSGYLAQPAAISAVFQSLQEKLKQRPEMMRRMVLEDPILEGLSKEGGGGFVDMVQSSHGRNVALKAAAAAGVDNNEVDLICSSATADVLDVFTDKSSVKTWLSEIVDSRNVEQCCTTMVNVVSSTPFTRSLLGNLTEQIVLTSGKYPTDAFSGKVFRALLKAVCGRYLVTQQIPQTLWTALKDITPSKSQGDSITLLGDSLRNVYRTAFLAWPDEAHELAGNNDSAIVNWLTRLVEDSYALETEEGKKALTQGAQEVTSRGSGFNAFMPKFAGIDFSTWLLKFLANGGRITA